MILDANKLLSQSEVCALLGVSQKTLQMLRRHHKIGFARLGHRTIRFRPEQVDAFLRKRESAVIAVEEEFQ